MFELALAAQYATGAAARRTGSRAIAGVVVAELSVTGIELTGGRFMSWGIIGWISSVGDAPRDSPG